MKNSHITTDTSTDLSQPGFVLEKDYVLVCLDIDHYYTVAVLDCVVVTEFNRDKKSVSLVIILLL